MNPTFDGDEDRSFISDGLTDEDFADLAAESFRRLDDEEARRSDRDKLIADLEASAEDEAAGRLHDAEDVFAEMAAKYKIRN